MRGFPQPKTIENHSPAFLSLDHTWRILTANQQVALAAGLEPGALNGKQLWEAFPNLAGTPLEACLRRVMQDRQPTHLEPQNPLRADDWQNLVVFPTQEGISVYWVSPSGQAELERRYAELEAENHWLRALFEGSQEAILMADDRGKYIEANPAALQLLGYEREELLERGVVDITPGIDRVAGQALWQAFLEEGSQRGEYTVVCKDGTLREVEYRAVANIIPGVHLSVLRDITEQKRATEEFRHQRELLQKIFDHIPVMIAVYHPDTRVTQLNREFERITGWTTDEARQVDLMEKIYPDPEYRAWVRAYMDSVEEGWRDLQMTARDGRIVESTWSNIRLSDDTQVGIGIDISERKQAERQLSESEQHLRNVLNSLFAFVGVLTPEGILIQANRAPLEAGGLTFEEVVGKRFEDTYWWNYSPLVKARIRQAIETAAQGKISRFDVEARMAGGRMVNIDFMISPLLDSKGYVQYLIPTGVDITRRKQAEALLVERNAALRESSRRLAEILESIEDGFFALDRDWRFTYVNRRAAQTGNLKPEELIGRNVWEEWPQLLDTPLERSYRQAMEERIPVNLEVKGILSGQWYEVRVYPSSEGISVFWVDLTERKKLEQALHQANDELESRVQERTRELLELRQRLIDSVEIERLRVSQELHDGPMQEIYGLIYNMAVLKDSGAGEAWQVEIDSYQSKLREINEWLRSVTRELRPSSLAPFGLETAILEHAERFTKDHSKLKIHLDLMPDGQNLPEWVRLALFRIYQVALTNAIRHSRANRVDIRFSFDASQAVLEVTDDGQGFEVPDRWITFARAGHLGLAGAAERAEVVGGRLEVQSQPGIGTRLRVIVPLI